MISTTLFAQVASDGFHIQCGRRECPECDLDLFVAHRSVTREEITERRGGDRHNQQYQQMLHEQGDPYCYLVFIRGFNIDWEQRQVIPKTRFQNSVDSDLYRARRGNRDAAARLERARSFDFRKPNDMGFFTSSQLSTVDEDGGQRQVRQHWDRRIRISNEELQQYSWIVLCPYCGGHNLLPAELLD